MKRILLVVVALLVVCGTVWGAVNVNTATREDLTSIKGVSEKNAQDIIDYRMKNGPFKSVDDLKNVPGISPGFLKQIRSQLSTTGTSVIERPATKATKIQGANAKASAPGKYDGLKSNKHSKKVAGKLTTGTKGAEKKTK